MTPKIDGEQEGSTLIVSQTQGRLRIVKKERKREAREENEEGGGGRGGGRGKGEKKENGE